MRTKQMHHNSELQPYRHEAEGHGSPCWLQFEVYRRCAIWCGLMYQWYHCFDCNVSLFSPGLPGDWYPNLDALKESCRIASSYNWADVDLSPFQGIIYSFMLVNFMSKSYLQFSTTLLVPFFALPSHVLCFETTHNKCSNLRLFLQVAATHDWIKF